MAGMARKIDARIKLQHGFDGGLFHKCIVA
jgi:hypothetical protein